MNSRLVLPLLAASALFVSACGRHPDSTAAAPALPPARVRLAVAQTADRAEITEITGVVRPVHRAQLAAKVMGAIAELPVTLGQRVKRGDLLVKISAGEISARVAQAQSQLNAARRDLDRERELLTKGASTRDMVRGLEDRFAAAEAMVREAESMLAYTEMRAPFDGVIARKMANAGDLASPGSPLLELEGTAEFQVEAGVPDSLAARLTPGAALHVEVPASDAKFSGQLAEISSAADPTAMTVLVKIAVPSGARVRSGQFARVQIPGASAPALLVPAAAISRMGQMQRIFVAGEGNRAVLRLVKTGAEREGLVEVLAGLDDRERVVVSPPAALREGQPLESVQ